MLDYKLLVKPIIANEKGYSDHPSDKGGPTKDGITEKVARLNGYEGPMMDMPSELIEQIYINRYIKDPKFDKVIDISPLIGEELIDTGVNMGPAVAGTIFQKLLNIFNVRGSKYADLFVDGRLGPATLDAFKSYLAFRGPEGEQVMLKALNHLQGARYYEIAANNESQEDFAYGWFKNRT